MVAGTAPEPALDLGGSGAGLSPKGYPAIHVAGGTVNLMLFVPGSEDQKIEPLHRHRVRVIAPKGGKPRPQMYADPRSAAFEEYVGDYSRGQALATDVQDHFAEMGLESPDFTLPLAAGYRVMVTLRFNLPKPKSYPARVVHHTKKPDLDNYSKAILDGLVKGRIIEDDGMITDLTIQKRYIEPGHPHGVEIDLTAVPCEVV